MMSGRDVEGCKILVSRNDFFFLLSMILFLIVLQTHSRGFVQIELIGTLTLTVFQKKTHDLQWSSNLVIEEVLRASS